MRWYSRTSGAGGGRVTLYHRCSSRSVTCFLVQDTRMFIVLHVAVPRGQECAISREPRAASLTTQKLHRQAVQALPRIVGRRRTLPSPIACSLPDR